MYTSYTLPNVHLPGPNYAMRDVKDMGQQMGYRSLEWNWPKEAMNIWLVLLMEPSCFNLLVNS